MPAAFCLWSAEHLTYLEVCAHPSPAIGTRSDIPTSGHDALLVQIDRELAETNGALEAYTKTIPKSAGRTEVSL